jgi:plastocyanin
MQAHGNAAVVLRRAGLAAVALALVLPGAGAGHPGHGPTHVTIGDSAFAPATAEVQAGDTVLWFWEGRQNTKHSVTADPGQAEAFDSDPGKDATTVTHVRGDVYGHKFAQVGTFTYACKVHPGERGTIVVRTAPPPPEFPPPSLSDVSVRPKAACARRRGGCSTRVVVRFTVATDALVKVRLVRGTRTARRRELTVAEGAHRVTLSVRGLRPARYRVDLDASSNWGNDSAVKPLRVR